MNNGLKGMVIIGNTLFVYFAALVSILMDWSYKGWVIDLKENILRHTDGYLTKIVLLFSIVILSLNVILLVKSGKTGEDASELACFNMMIRLIQLPASYTIFFLMVEDVDYLFFHYINIMLGNGSIVQRTLYFITSNSNCLELLWINYAAVISMGIFSCVVFHKLRKNRKISCGTQAACSFFSFIFGVDVIFAIVGCIWSKS